MAFLQYEGGGGKEGNGNLLVIDLLSDAAGKNLKDWPGSQLAKDTNM